MLQHVIYNRVLCQLMTDSLEKFGDIVSGTLGPFPGKSIIIQHAGHHVVYTRTIPETCAFGIVVVWHVEPVMHSEYFFQVDVIRTIASCTKSEKKKKRRNFIILEIYQKCREKCIFLMGRVHSNKTSHKESLYNSVQMIQYISCKEQINRILYD